jgi:sugar-specific transcriptional regulator TrmB
MPQDGSTEPMDDLVHQLTRLGLTDNEARGYATLLRFGALTGYEVAKRSGIARGNVYASLGRLIEKQAVTRTSEDQFIALPLAQFVTLQQQHLSLAAEQAQRTLLRLQQSSEAAQVISMIGTETLLERCMAILQEAQRPVFIAGFPEDLNILASSLKPAQRHALPIEAISFGPPPATLPDAIEHFAADDIHSAQQGRLLLLASWPYGIVGILNEDGTKTTGIWSWNRYLATVIGLYIAHERFTLQLWSRLPIALQHEFTAQFTDLSSRIALAGLSPDQPLRHLLEGILTPSVEHPSTEESTHES